MIVVEVVAEAVVVLIPVVLVNATVTDIGFGYHYRCIICSISLRDCSTIKKHNCSTISVRDITSNIQDIIVAMVQLCVVVLVVKAAVVAVVPLVLNCVFVCFSVC